MEPADSGQERVELGRAASAAELVRLSVGWTLHSPIAGALEEEDSTAYQTSFLRSLPWPAPENNSSWLPCASVVTSSCLPTAVQIHVSRSTWTIRPVHDLDARGYPENA